MNKNCKKFGCAKDGRILWHTDECEDFQYPKDSENVRLAEFICTSCETYHDTLKEAERCCGFTPKDSKTPLKSKVNKIFDEVLDK